MFCLRASRPAPVECMSFRRLKQSVRRRWLRYRQDPASDMWMSCIEIDSRVVSLP